MSNRKRRAPSEPPDAPSLGALLGTDDPERQIRLVRNLIEIAVGQEVFMGVFLRPQTGQYRVVHAEGARYQELKNALDAGLEYLTERRVRAQLEQAYGPSEQPQTGPGTPGRGGTGRAEDADGPIDGAGVADPALLRWERETGPAAEGAGFGEDTDGAQGGERAAATED